MLNVDNIQSQVEEFFGKPISTYSRAEAIEDGILSDVTEEAKKSGFKYPVAVTAAVWEECLVPSDHCRKFGESEQGRMWDMFSMLRWAIKAQPDPCDEVNFTVKFGRQNYGLKSICGPGDTPEPVITIMMREES
jgi:hypothetical protein